MWPLSMPGYWAVKKQNDNTMKKANEYTKKDVKRRAYAIIYSTDAIVLQRPRYRLDLRYNFSREVLAFVRANALSESERQRVLQLRRQRAKNKPQPFKRLLDLPIVKDWRNNRYMVKHVNESRLHFYDGRNHWAKTDTDKRFLKILCKVQ